MKKIVGIVVVLAAFILTASPAPGLTLEEIIRLKEAGVSDETIQKYIELEKERLRRERTPAPGAVMGRRTVRGPDGKKKVIIYSIQDPAKVREEEAKSEKDERRSWEMLKGLVIDAR